MSNSNVTIQEEYRLPSLGKIYGKPFDPNVKLRSMTVAEEMKRLTATDNPYRTMADIIDDCLVTKLPISAYDLCLGDYQYLLHRLRVVTYGPEYKLTIRCPFCLELFDYTIDLDTLKVTEYDSNEVDKYRFIKLPVTGKTIEMSFQTPRALDTIEQKKKQMKKQFPEMKEDPTLMLNLESVIKSVDGQEVNPATIQFFIKNLPLRDSNLILKNLERLNSKVGVDIDLDIECPECHNNIKTTFRYTNEFFRPEID